MFKTNNEILDEIQKSLELYLETKRQSFPRFYFLSNDELLEILSKSNDLNVIQLHLRTCFDNILRLEIHDGQDIVAMISGESEVVPFVKTVKTRQLIEVWLSAVQAMMIETLQKAMRAGYVDYTLTDRKEWVLKHPGQIIASIS
jgi:dynein heavy chain